MKGHVPSYDLRSARSLGEALGYLKDPQWKPFAGGSDLMVELESGRLDHRQFVSIDRIAELKTLTESEQSLRVGAAVTYGELQQSSVIHFE